MFKQGFFLLIMMFLLGSLSACAEFKEAGRSIGHAGKEVGIAIGHGSRDAAKEVANETSKAADSVAESVKDEDDD